MKPFTFSPKVQTYYVALIAAANATAAKQPTTLPAKVVLPSIETPETVFVRKMLFPLHDKVVTAQAAIEAFRRVTAYYPTQFDTSAVSYSFP